MSPTLDVGRACPDPGRVYSDPEIPFLRYQPAHRLVATYSDKWTGQLLAAFLAAAKSGEKLSIIGGARAK